ncbi:hypothetical protein Pelo_19267 [Pelomyxa schiedti]|nr:hypothetical protein Pelo_19267 [Pelomyxa schiedti]
MILRNELDSTLLEIACMTAVEWGGQIQIKIAAAKWAPMTDPERTAENVGSAAKQQPKIAPTNKRPPSGVPPARQPATPKRRRRALTADATTSSPAATGTATATTTTGGGQSPPITHASTQGSPGKKEVH